MSQIFKRRIVREKVLQILFSNEMNREGLSEIKNSLLSEVNDKSDKAFADLLIKTVIQHQKEFDKEIESRVTNWEMSRIALIDKILLRMGLCELLYFPDIPPKVSINEAIEIAKVYSTAGSGKFINGILDAALSEFREAGKLAKTGRGLVEETIPKPPNKKS